MKDEVTPMTIVKNNIGDFIHQQNIVTMSHIDRLDIHPHILHKTNNEVNYLIIVDIGLLVYQ